MTNCLNSSKAAFADSTIKSYRSDFAHFSHWCEKNGIDAANVSQEDLAQFVEHMAAGSSGATIRRHVASIGSIYKLSGHSFRVGAALDLLERGESMEKIMLRGGWQSESTVIRYLRAWQVVQ